MTEESQFPRVTFALFAYNQENYIREAVEAALVQDYPNLEIIISDDCSSDSTFAVIEEKVRSYVGPHRVVARQTSENRGSLLHVDEVARIAHGKLLVLAAGDDVSKQDRASVLQKAWAESGAWGLCSRFDRISADGTLLARNVRSPVIDRHGFERYFFAEDGPVHVVHGCTSAYDARVFEHLDLTSKDYILAEDGALSVLLNLIGKDFLYIEESLVLYRESPSSLTNSSVRRALSLTEIDRDERNIERFARSQANRCKLFLRMDKQCSSNVRKLNINGVCAELAVQEGMAYWFQWPPWQRMSALFRRGISLKWSLPRIFGRGFFYTMKWVITRLR